MRLWFPLLLLCAGLTACADDRDPARYQFGVSADRPAATGADPAIEAALDRKSDQICTLGYHTVRADALGAEGGRQIVDRHLECNEYSPDLWPQDLAVWNADFPLFNLF